MKTTKLFSRPLFGQNIRTYCFFAVAVVLIMSMMSCVGTIAIDAIQEEMPGSMEASVLEKLDKVGIQIPQMDPSVILDTMYYKVIMLIPIFLLVVVVSNGLIAAQLDDGSMAYILSTPIERKAVAFTHMIFSEKWFVTKKQDEYFKMTICGILSGLCIWCIKDYIIIFITYF